MNFMHLRIDLKILVFTRELTTEFVMSCIQSIAILTRGSLEQKKQVLENYQVLVESFSLLCFMQM